MGFLVLVGTHAEVLDSLTRVLGTAKNQGVGTGRGTQSQLVKGDGLTTSGDDASAGGSGETQSSNGELRHGQETVVVGNGANDNNGSLVIGSGVRNNSAERNGGTVDLGHKEAAQDNLVEIGVGTARQEAVQLHQELEVDIVALRGLAMGPLDVVAVQIDTYKVKPSSAIWSKHAHCGRARSHKRLHCGWRLVAQIVKSHKEYFDLSTRIRSAEKVSLHVPMAAVRPCR